MEIQFSENTIMEIQFSENTIMEIKFSENKCGNRIKFFFALIHIPHAQKIFFQINPSM